MFFNLILRILLFFQICFFIKCDEHIKIYDDGIKGYFGNIWVNNISTERDVILVKMTKKNNLDDYNSTFEYERDFNYNKQDYRLNINVGKDHNLEYSIYKKVKMGDDYLYAPITDFEKEIFYRDTKIYKNGRVEIKKTMKSLFDSGNWVLIRVITNDNKEFYAFINNIFPYYYGSNLWGPLAYGSKFKELYIIYSNIQSIPFLTSSEDQTYYDFIDLKGLNFEYNTNIELINWFLNAKSLKKFKNIPKFTDGINISKMLNGCESLEEISLGNNKIYSASNCFQGCSNLKNIDLTNTYIDKNANLKYMFEDCKNIEKIEGIEQLVTKDDKPDVEYMFKNANIKHLDLSQWGTNIKPEGMLKNGKVKSLKLFNLKKILEYYIEICKKEIPKLEKRINNNEKDLKEYRKKLEELEQIELKTEDDKKAIKNFNELIETKKDDIKKKKDMIKQYQDEIAGNGKGLNILEDSTVDELYINEEFMPEDKKDLDRLVGNNCTVGMIYIVDKDGKCKKYKDFNDYKNNIEYKDEEQHNIPINQPQQPEIIKEKEIQKPNSCITCCGKCFKSCCCCCKSKT